jgi:hypothetical protein
MTFGMCLICGACVLICTRAAYEWNHSEQKAHEEYWRFRFYMKKLDADKESQRTVINDIKSIDELVSVNNKLKKVTRDM